MNTIMHETVEVPGESLVLKKEMSVPIGGTVCRTSFSAMVPYEQVRHLLAAGPLRRPNRTRPLPSEQPSLAQLCARLRDMKAVKDGWLDGAGLAPRAEVLDRVAGALGPLASAGKIPRTFLFPTEGGGIQAEWSICGWEVSAQFEPDSDVWFHAVNVQTRETREESVRSDVVGLRLTALLGDLRKGASEGRR